MLYELVNPSDPYVFEADSFPVAVATAWLISPVYAAKPEEGDDYFGIPAFMEEPAKEYKEQFGDSVEDFINKHNAEIVHSSGSKITAAKTRKLSCLKSTNTTRVDPIVTAGSVADI